VTDGIRALVALDRGVNREAVEAALPSGSEIHIVGIVEGIDESWTTLQETQTDLLVVACQGYSDRALFMISGAIKQRSDRPVIVLTEGSPNGFFKRVFEAGADDILSLPESPEHVRFALQKAMARKLSLAVGTGVAECPMICVLGPKGGTGKTLVAGNLAVLLSGEGKRAVILDLDLQFGDAGLSLGLAPDRTMYDLVRSGGSLDAEKVEDYIIRHASGAGVLMAPTRPDQAGHISVEFLREVYGILRSSHDFVIVDTPPGFVPEVISAIDSSSDVCMVGMLDSLSLKNTKLGYETLDLMGYDPDRVKLVLNRADSRVGITREDVTTIIGHVPDIMVPSDRDIPRSINEGEPIVLWKPRSEATKAFRALAQIYLPKEPDAHKLAGWRLLGRKA
jgi:pilus assembly protein CpaE